MRDPRLRLWLDDLRPPPDGGWTWVTSAWDAIDALKRGVVGEVSLDHDLGPPDAGSGYDVAEWIEAEAYHGRLPRLRWALHSANPIGVERMRRALERAERFWAGATGPPGLAGDAADPV